MFDLVQEIECHHSNFRTGNWQQYSVDYGIDRETYYFNRGMGKWSDEGQERFDKKLKKCQLNAIMS